VILIPPTSSLSPLSLLLLKQTKTFEDISEDIVTACHSSLLSASQAIAKKSKIDGQLFLIKHLLILREQIAPFEANFLHTESAINYNQLRGKSLGLVAHLLLRSLIFFCGP